LDQLNRDIVADLQERGIAAPSTTRLNGKVAIRVAIVNHRSRREDFDLLVRSVVAIGQQRTLAINT
jgi:aromatic-L-amino-acid/L-tryptophan decarboxylase